MISVIKFKMILYRFIMNDRILCIKSTNKIKSLVYKVIVFNLYICKGWVGKLKVLCIPTNIMPLYYISLIHRWAVKFLSNAAKTTISLAQQREHAWKIWLGVELNLNAWVRIYNIKIVHILLLNFYMSVQL